MSSLIIRRYELHELDVWFDFCRSGRKAQLEVTLPWCWHASTMAGCCVDPLSGRSNLSSPHTQRLFFLDSLPIQTTPLPRFCRSAGVSGHKRRMSRFEEAVNDNANLRGKTQSTAFGYKSLAIPSRSHFFQCSLYSHQESSDNTVARPSTEQDFTSTPWFRKSRRVQPIKLKFRSLRLKPLSSNVSAGTRTLA